MLATVAPGAGQMGPGFVSVEAGLPVEAPTQWAPCRYAVGDVLWVRETFAYTSCERDEPGAIPVTAHPRMHFEFGNPTHFRVRYLADLEEIDWDPPTCRPSIFMPRWAARIFLRVEAVRVERLNAISEADAIAEGATRRAPGWSMDWSEVGTPSEWSSLARSEATAVMKRGRCLPQPLSEEDVRLGSPQMAFANLWDRINAKRAPWASNPWVYVVAFRRVTP